MADGTVGGAERADATTETTSGVGPFGLQALRGNAHVHLTCRITWLWPRNCLCGIMFPFFWGDHPREALWVGMSPFVRDEGPLLSLGVVAQTNHFRSNILFGPSFDSGFGSAGVGGSGLRPQLLCQVCPAVLCHPQLHLSMELLHVELQISCLVEPLGGHSGNGVLWCDADRHVHSMAVQLPAETSHRQ